MCHSECHFDIHITLHMSNVILIWKFGHFKPQNGGQVLVLFKIPVIERHC